jgi:FixJ family two-component response regulator
MLASAPQLTRREREVLRCADLPARQVAVQLLMPVPEVLEYRQRLRAKGVAAAPGR